MIYSKMSDSFPVIMWGAPIVLYSRGSQPFLLRGPPPSPVNFARPPWHFLLYCTSAAERKVFIFKLFLLTKTFVLPYYYYYYIIILLLHVIKNKKNSKFKLQIKAILHNLKGNPLLNSNFLK